MLDAARHLPPPAASPAVLTSGCWGWPGRIRADGQGFWDGARWGYISFFIRWGPLLSQTLPTPWLPELAAWANPAWHVSEGARCTPRTSRVSPSLPVCGSLQGTGWEGVVLTHSWILGARRPRAWHEQFMRQMLNELIRFSNRIGVRFALSPGQMSPAAAARTEIDGPGLADRCSDRIGGGGSCCEQVTQAGGEPRAPHTPQREGFRPPSWAAPLAWVSASQTGPRGGRRMPLSWAGPGSS